MRYITTQCENSMLNRALSRSDLKIVDLVASYFLFLCGHFFPSMKPSWTCNRGTLGSPLFHESQMDGRKRGMWREISSSLYFAPTPCPDWLNCNVWGLALSVSYLYTSFQYLSGSNFFPVYGLNVSALFSSLQGRRKGVWSISNQDWKIWMLAEAKGNKPRWLARGRDHDPINAAAASLLWNCGPRVAWSCVLPHHPCYEPWKRAKEICGCPASGLQGVVLDSSGII